MRLGALAIAVVLVLTLALSQISLPQMTNAETTDLAITACAVQGGDCPETSLDSTPGTVLSHTVFDQGCASSDLHVMKYLADESEVPVVATWCS